VIGFVVAIWSAVLMTAFWILVCPTKRLPLVLGNLNANWKVCLLLLIPLFYRTMKGVLLRIRKFPLGMEAQEPEEVERERTKTEARRKPSEEES